MISEKKYHKRCTFLHHGACMHQKSQQGIQRFKLPLCGLVIFTDMNTYMYILIQKEAGVSKHLKKIMQLLWTAVTYLLKNVKHGIEHDIDSAYRDIRLS